MENQIGELIPDLDRMNNDGLERMTKLAEIHDVVRKAPDTMVAFSGLLSSIISLVLPYGVPYLVDLLFSP